LHAALIEYISLEELYISLILVHVVTQSVVEAFM